MKNNPIHLSGLNGLRAIAAISVLIGHITSSTFCNFNFNLPVVRIGEHGVTLFFVISGFLITFLLLIEKDKTKSIDIKKFYLRRILRIWPIYYLFVFVCYVLAFFISDIENIHSLNSLWYVFFTANIALIMNESVRIIIHFWSIGVEEQFYLFWPWIVKKVNSRMVLITLLVVVLLFATKSVSWMYLGNKSILYKFLNVTRFHCMLIGAIGAMFYYKNYKFFIEFCTNKIIQIISWLLFVLIFTGIVTPPAPIVAEIIAVLSLLLIMGQVTKVNRLINLETALFDFTGKISYGIYVIHPLIILLLSILFKDLSLPYFLQTVVVYSSVIGITIFIAYLSYEYYEKPFLKLKSRFTVVQSQSSKL